MNLPIYLDALHSFRTIKTSDGNLTVTTTSCTGAVRPVAIHVGIFSGLLTLEEARDLGAALIEGAHYWQAELAKCQQEQQAQERGA